MKMISGKMTLLAAAALAGMSRGFDGLGQRAVAGLPNIVPTAPTSPNGGRRKHGNRSVQRAAIKRRNVRKFRQASRGRA